MPHTLRELAEFTATLLIGDGSVEVMKVASVAQAQPGDLIFVQDEKDLPQALSSRASAVIAGEFAEYCDSRKPLLIAGESAAGVLPGGRAAAPAENLRAWRASHGCGRSFCRDRRDGSR